MARCSIAWDYRGSKALCGWLRLQLLTIAQLLVVLRGLAGSHLLDEAERSLHDALCVLSQTVKDSRVVLGGGWPEVHMAQVLA